MKFAVITHVQHYKNKVSIEAYAPYVKEMNLWFKHVEAVRVVAPLKESSSRKDALLLAYHHQHLKIESIPAFSLTNFSEKLKTIGYLPLILIQIFRTCLWADHIHLRCPGNMGFLGCLVQIFFPFKVKSAKYAGNWDPKSKQPISYILQKRLLNNPILTRNMRVMVYGQWPSTSKNIVPFFTATYSEKDKISMPERDYSGDLYFVFAGSLTENKNPLKVVQWIHHLIKTEGLSIKLDFLGEGPERQKLEAFILKNKLEKSVTLQGNQPESVIKTAYQKAHFLVLPSRSEGWPKVVAEAMFWGVIPLASSVSCVPWMLGHGQRGLLFEEELHSITQKLIALLKNPESAQKMAKEAVAWSQQYTLEKFESEILKILNPEKT